MTWGTSWLAKMGRFASVAKSGSRRHKQRNRRQLLRHEADALLGMKDKKTPHQNTKDTKKQP